MIEFDMHHTFKRCPAVGDYKLMGVELSIESSTERVLVCSGGHGYFDHHENETTYDHDSIEIHSVTLMHKDTEEDEIWSAGDKLTPLFESAIEVAKEFFHGMPNYVFGDQ